MNHANDTTRTRLRPLAADHTGGAPRAIALLPHAALTPPLIHHCLLLFPHHICRGRHSWPRGKWIETATRLRFPDLHMAEIWFLFFFYHSLFLSRCTNQEGNHQGSSCLEALYTDCKTKHHGRRKLFSHIAGVSRGRRLDEASPYERLSPATTFKLMKGSGSETRSYLKRKSMTCAE